MSVLYSFDWYPWVLAICDKCGPFTGAVHVVDEDVLFAEGKKHENDCKND